MAYQGPMNYNMAYYPPMTNGAVPDMLNQYKGAYQQPMQMPMPIQHPVQAVQMQTPANTSDMIWVLSEVEAQSYPVAPNNSVILWDKNNDVVYIKSVNMQGVPSMRVLDYKERTTESTPKMPEKHECKCGDRFVSKEAFQALQKELEALQAKVEMISIKPKTKTAKVIVEEDENDG